MKIFLSLVLTTCMMSIVNGKAQAWKALTAASIDAVLSASYHGVLAVGTPLAGRISGPSSHGWWSIHRSAVLPTSVNEARSDAPRNISPLQERVTLRLSSNDAVVQVVDITGRCVTVDATRSGTFYTVDVSALIPGVYFLTSHDNSRVQRYRIAVTR